MAARSPEPAKRWDEPPVLESVRRGALAPLDIGQDLDRGAGAGARGHPLDAMVRRAATMIHIRARPMAPTRNTGERWAMRFEVTWI